MPVTVCVVADGGKSSKQVDRRATAANIGDFTVLLKARSLQQGERERALLIWDCAVCTPCPTGSPCLVEGLPSRSATLQRVTSWSASPWVLALYLPVTNLASGCFINASLFPPTSVAHGCHVAEPHSWRRGPCGVEAWRSSVIPFNSPQPNGGSAVVHACDCDLRLGLDQDEFGTSTVVRALSGWAVNATVQRETVYFICRRNLGIDRPTWTHLQQTSTQVTSVLTACARSAKAQKGVAWEFSTSLAPYMLMLSHACSTTTSPSCVWADHLLIGGRWIVEPERHRDPEGRGSPPERPPYTKLNHLLADHLFDFLSVSGGQIRWSTERGHDWDPHVFFFVPHPRCFWRQAPHALGKCGLPGSTGWRRFEDDKIDTSTNGLFGNGSCGCTSTLFGGHFQESGPPEHLDPRICLTLPVKSVPSEVRAPATPFLRWMRWLQSCRWHRRLRLSDVALLVQVRWHLCHWITSQTRSGFSLRFPTMDFPWCASAQQKPRLQQLFESRSAPHAVASRPLWYQVVRARWQRLSPVRVLATPHIGGQGDCNRVVDTASAMGPASLHCPRRHAWLFLSLGTNWLCVTSVFLFVDSMFFFFLRHPRKHFWQVVLTFMNVKCKSMTHSCCRWDSWESDTWRWRCGIHHIRLFPLHPDRKILSYLLSHRNSIKVCHFLKFNSSSIQWRTRIFKNSECVHAAQDDKLTLINCNDGYEDTSLSLNVRNERSSRIHWQTSHSFQNITYFNFCTMSLRSWHGTSRHDPFSIWSVTAWLTRSCDPLRNCGNLLL